MTFQIPDEALHSHVGILGKTGAGKTYTARGLAERLLALHRQTVIVDPTGAWYGLRTGFDIPIFGGRHGDIEISDKAGEAVARVIVEQRASAIVDLSLMSGGAQRRFMTAFAHRLRAKPPGALWLIIDEADEFLPQVLQPDMTNLFGDLKWMVRRGRLNGFRVMMVTQRPAEIAKAVLTQIETLVAHRLTAPQDRKAVEEWVKGHHDAAEAREVLSSLASLEKGEAWVWSPDLGLLVREKMPAIATFDSGRTPEPGEEAVQPPALADLDLAAIRDALAVIAEPEPTKAAKIIPGNMPSWPDQREEVAALRNETAALKAENARLHEACDTIRGILDAHSKFTASLGHARTEGDPAPTRRETSRKPDTPRVPVTPPRPVQGLTAGETAPALNAAASALAGLLKSMPGRKAAWSNLLIMAGFRPGSGWIRKSRNELVEQGYIAFSAADLAHGTDKLDGDDILALTPPIPAELREVWKAKLRGPGGQMAAWLAEHGPATREEIARGIGMSPTAGWSRKGFKDLLGSNLAHDAGDGRLAAHPLLVDAR